MLGVSPGVGAQGMPAELRSKPDQPEQKGEQPQPSSGERAGPSGSRAVGLAPARGHWPAWRGRAGMAPVLAACLSRPRALVQAAARWELFLGGTPSHLQFH